ncbi:MAG: hypothetical protein NTY53_26740 [Kiritimatiellaeota bacterium]|nr:hypothetical protein [Kiritimatiellota bacterium]
MSKPWTREELLELARGFQPTCVLAAAAELDLFDALERRPLTAAQTARKITANPRAVTVLLDALVALRLLTKHGPRYALAAHHSRDHATSRELPAPVGPARACRQDWQARAARAEHPRRGRRHRLVHRRHG